MTNKKIARALKQTASLIELTGGNPFRARAFENAARTIDRLERPAAALLEEGTLTEVPGIGSGLVAQIRQLVETDSFDLLDELRNSLPPGLLDLLRIKGLGARKIRRLWQALHITSLEELEHAIHTEQVASLDGFGKKTAAHILVQIELLRKYDVRRRYAQVYQMVQPILEVLRALPGVQRAEMTGELRRGLETIGAAELIVTSDQPETIRQALTDMLLSPEEEALRPNDSVIFSGFLPDDLPLVVHGAPPDSFGTDWWWHTGSQEHCEAYVTHYGKPAPAGEEEAIYEAAGLCFLPPELREGAGELDGFSKEHPPRLIEAGDLRGTLHNHTTYSDGAHTLREMAEAARAMGYEYFGVCDHSQSLTIAGGLSVAEVRAQQREIASLNEEMTTAAGRPFRILSGIESDILTDGSLDYPEDVLKTFDFVVASIHSGFNMTEEQASRRLVNAVENPYTTILGHATGRLLLSREGYPIDHLKVIEACAANGVAIELNANPYRLDMDWRWLREATARGVLISINPDAHSIDELHYVQWGVTVARKGWLRPDQCLNAMPLEAFMEWMSEGRRAKGEGRRANGEGRKAKSV